MTTERASARGLLGAAWMLVTALVASIHAHIWVTSRISDGAAAGQRASQRQLVSELKIAAHR